MIDWTIKTPVIQAGAAVLLLLVLIALFIEAADLIDQWRSHHPRQQP